MIQMATMNIHNFFMEVAQVYQMTWNKTSVAAFVWLFLWTGHDYADQSIE